MNQKIKPGMLVRLSLFGQWISYKIVDINGNVISRPMTPRERRFLFLSGKNPDDTSVFVESETCRVEKFPYDVFFVVRVHYNTILYCNRHFNEITSIDLLGGQTIFRFSRDEPIFIDPVSQLEYMMAQAPSFEDLLGPTKPCNEP